MALMRSLLPMLNNGAAILAGVVAVLRAAQHMEFKFSAYREVGQSEPVPFVLIEAYD